MSLGYASFSDSAAQELLPMHEKEDQADFEYRLHDSQQKYQKRSCSNFGEMKERFYGIPPQDEISKKKERIHKWQLLTMVLALSGVFLAFWGYNARNRVVTIEVKSVATFPIPKLTLCVPGGVFFSTPHLFILKQYNLTNVRMPGDFVSSRDIQMLCASTFNGIGNCGDFIEYEDDCIRIGIGNNEILWNLTTAGQSVLSFYLVYPSRYYDVHNLILPFFYWSTNCTVGRNGSLSNVEECTKKTNFNIFEERTENPVVLYQVEPGQLTLADVRKEVHVNSSGIRNEVYPTTFVNFPFTDSDNQLFNNSCNTLGLSTKCDVIFFGIRSISQTVLTTYEERYFLSIIRSFGTAASLIALVSGICTFVYAFFITKLIFREKHAHLDHDLRDAIIYLHKKLSAVDKNRG